MPNAQAENYALFASNEKFSAIWKLTRVMKAAGWRYQASSDATTKESGTANPANDKWGGGVQVGAQTATVAFTIGTPTTTSFGGRSTITGLTGFTAASVGRYLTITGATNGANNGTWLITAFVSATSVVIENPAAVAETTPGTATWTEKDALLDTYPVAFQGAGAAGAWWCAQGPSTMKVLIGATTPTGTFQRGENVVQTTSGATGELLGVVTDSGGGGYLVIAPRLSGTGAGPRGWSASATITGDTSGATVAPTTTVIEFVREIVIWKGSATAGHVYFQVIDQASEASATATNGRFSVLAALGTATATICPGGATGGSPTTNGFPTTGTYVVMGTGGSGAGGTSSSDFTCSTVSVTTGKAQILCANAIEDAGVSPDASIAFAIGVPAVSANVYVGWMYQRVDDSEDGDVDPYVFWAPGGLAAYARTRTAMSTQTAASDTWNTTFITAAAKSSYLGWRRRGYSSGDTFQEYEGGCLGQSLGTLSLLTQNAASPDRVACAFVNVAVREPIWVGSLQIGFKMRKGTLRWAYMVQGGNGTDTYDGKRWMQMSSSASLPVVVGPADGTTAPANS